MRFFSISLLALTGCVTKAGGTPLNFKETLQELIRAILDVFTLEFLQLTDQTRMAAFLRILLFIAIYAAMYEVLTNTILRNPQQRRTAVVVSIILSLVSIITLPVEVLLTIGGLYGSIIGAAFILVPVAITFFIIWGTPSTTRPQLIFKIGALAILLWVLTIVSKSLSELGSVV